MANEWKEEGVALTAEPLFHGSAANFDQFAYQQNHTTGISGLKFGIYLTNDKETALGFAENKYLYEVNPGFLDKRALQPAEVTLSRKDVSQILEFMVKNEIQENEISYFFSDYFGDVAELSETETWNELYDELTNIAAESMMSRASNDVDIANEIYYSFGGKNSDSAAIDLGKALKNVGVTYCVQPRRYEQERAIQEIVVFQPDELIIQNKIDITKLREQQQSVDLQNEKATDEKGVTPIVIKTRNKQKQNAHVMEEQLER
ncbi:hypothetical protein CW829_14255 [Listeria monocytogenes]|nr:hypothetical protein [Listeria monocytogenes]